MKRKLLQLALLILWSPVSEAQDFRIQLQNISASTQAQIDNWSETQNLLLGIQAYDPEENTPTKHSQEKWGLLTPAKRNLSGVFNRYGTEEEGNWFSDHYEEPNAYDWNFMIQPFEKYMDIYRLALQSSYKDKSQWPGIIDYNKQQVRCDASDYNGKPGIMAEISPYHRFLNDNVWFKGTHDNHCKEGEYLKNSDTIAVYGCAVNDKAHGYNPEIHPAQQIWFRNKTKSKEKDQFYWLIFLQDASRRFGNWVNSPLYGQFRIAFKINTMVISHVNYTPLTMNIGIARKYDLVTNKYPAYSQDDDDGYSHSLLANGVKLLTVNEPADEDGYLGIKFVEITKPSPGIIQGYVQISMVLGDYNTDALGVCVLNLEVKSSSYLTSTELH